MEPREVEQAVPEVAYHRALVYEQAVENPVSARLERLALPKEFARVGDHAAAYGERLHVVFYHSCGQEVELYSARGVPGIRAAVHFQDNRGDVPPAATGLELVYDFVDETPLALVAHAYADVRNQLTFEFRYHDFKVCLYALQYFGQKRLICTFDQFLQYKSCAAEAKRRRIFV